MALNSANYGYIVDPLFSFTDDAGLPVANGYIMVFQAGTTTKTATYSSWEGDAFNPVQIPLDASGRPENVVIGGKEFLYKVMICDADHGEENPVREIDKVAVIGANVTNTGTITLGLNQAESESDIVGVEIVDKKIKITGLKKANDFAKENLADGLRIEKKIFASNETVEFTISKEVGERYSIDVDTDSDLFAIYLAVQGILGQGKLLLNHEIFEYTEEDLTIGRNCIRVYFNHGSTTESVIATRKVNKTSLDILNKKSEEILKSIFKESCVGIGNKNHYSDTSVGGFYNQSGYYTNDSSFNSCLLDVVNGCKYKVVQESSSYNIRLFEKRSNSERMTQISSKQGKEVFIDVPDDNVEHKLQVVRSSSASEIPSIFIPEKSSSFAEKTSSIKILAVGNSYSRDALSYVPFLIEDILGVSVKIGILYSGSCTLESHYSKILNNQSYEAFDKYNGFGSWATSSNNANFETAVSNEDWDVVLLQQQSNASRDYSTYQPYLNEIIDLLNSKVRNSIKIGWILTPSYPNNNPNIGTDTSVSMYNKIAECSEKVFNETAVEFIVPCGTAVQNARGTSLNSLGDTGELCADKLHLQEGIPCLLEAYVFALSILKSVGLCKKGIFGNKVRPTQSWIAEKNIIQQNGSSVGVNDENCIIAQKCAIMAVKKPFEISEII